MNIVKIEGLEVFAYHGVLEKEKKEGQPFFISATISFEFPSNDSILETLDYAAVLEKIEKIVKEKPYNLIETVAQKVAKGLLKEFPIIDEIEIEVKKPFAPLKQKVEFVSATVKKRQEVLVALSLGSNLQNKEDNLAQAVKYIKGLNQVENVKCSKPFITKPYGEVLDQPDFLNMAVIFTTTLSVSGLFSHLKSIEQKMGRKPAERHSARIIDIDISFYGSKIIKSGRLQIPHADLHNRLFVLEPLETILPNFIHPVFNTTVSQLISSLKKPS